MSFVRELTWNYFVEQFAFAFGVFIVGDGVRSY